MFRGVKMSQEFNKIMREYFTISKDILRLHYYKMLLKNEERMQRYQQAIEQTVNEQDVVFEIGSGLGTLSFMAARKARRVYAVEKDSEILLLSKKIARMNGLEDKIQFIEGNSFDVTLPEKAHVLLIETFGDLALEYNLLGCILDAKRRNLSSQAKLIPKEIRLYLVPFYSERIFCEQNGFWSTIFGINYVDVKTIADTIPFMDNIKSEEFVGEPGCFLDLNLAETSIPEVTGFLTFHFPKPTLINGFAGYFETTLSYGNVFSTKPGARNTSFRQYCFPLPHQLEVQEIDISLKNNPKSKEEVVKWDFEYKVRK